MDTMEMYSNQNGEEIMIEESALETRDGSLWAKMKWFWFRRTALEKALLLLVFLLLLALVAVIAHAVINRRQSYSPSYGGTDVCVNETCSSAAAEIISSMDLLADPCVDFYQYACGNWLRNNPIPENEKRINVLSKTAADVLAFCYKILKDETPINDSNDVLWKMNTFFRSCLDEDLIDKEGADPFLDFLNSYGGWHTGESHVSENGNTTEEDITSTFIKLFLASDPPLLIFIMPTNQDIRISKPPDSLNQSEMEKEREFIKEILPYLYPNGSTEVINQLAADLTHIHQTLVNCSPGKESGNLTTLQTLVPKIDWNRVIRSLLPEKFHNDPVRLYCVEYFRVLGYLMDSEPLRLFKQYMIWRVLHSLLPHAGGEIGKISRKYQNTKSTQCREEFCMELSIEYLESAIAGLFIERNINSEDFQSHISMFEQIKGAFKRLVETNEDLDESSRTTILLKIDKIILELAHPEYMFNRSLLNDAFMSLQIGDQYLTNIIAVRRHYFLYRLSGEWSAVTGNIRTTSSAAFLPYSVIVPVVTLLRPSLSVSKLRSLTFSGFGNTVGHELSHCLDKTHSKEWVELTESGRKIFEAKMECLVTALKRDMEPEYGGKSLMYSSFEKEFWSDVSGLQIAYQAFKTIPTEHITLPYLNRTLDQIFFLNFAQTMCGHITNKAMSNTYPPPKYRVLSTLRNTQSFSAAFGCALGSPMNPSTKKCDIWNLGPSQDLV